MLNKLVSYNFEIAGRLVLDQNNNIAYDIPVSKFISQDHAQVYAWVSGQDILYIGQAGKGLQKRHREHRAVGKMEVRRASNWRAIFAPNCRQVMTL